MTKRSFSVEEKISILEEAKLNGVSVTLRKFNIGSTLYYKWRDKFDLSGIDGLKSTYNRESVEVKRLKDENLRLKRLLAEKEVELQIQGELIKKKYKDEKGFIRNSKLLR